MPATFDQVRAKYPSLTTDEVQEVVDLLNRKRMTIREIWDNENDVSEVEMTVGADGLTRPMRECNRFAEEHALPLPFPTRK